jgi:hypothetical protein
MSRRSCYAMRYIIVGAWLGLVPSVTMAAPAARVEFVVGNVSAVSAAGQTRALGKGVDVDSGDTVNTHDGRVQLRFSDGAYVSLQPQTLFRIDDYRYDGKSDGNERGFFSLLKGGLRTITGLVGRTNKKNYRVSTTVATIGIRGTEYTLAYTNSVSGSVGEGEVEVCNGGGCLPVASGGSFFVSNSQVRPELTSKKSDLPPNQPGDVAGGKFATANNPSSTNGISSVAPTAPMFISADTSSLFLLTGQQALSLVTGGTPGLFSKTTVVLNPQGAVIQIDLSTTSANGQQLLKFPHGLDEFGHDLLITWGRGSGELGSSLPYVHYITGVPTSSTDLATLAANRTIASYSFVGGTTPTADMDGSTILATGKITSATLTADFSLGKVDAKVAFAISGVDFTANSKKMVMSGNVFSNAGTSPSDNMCTASAGTCKINYMAGFFSGPGAGRAGLLYDVCPGSSSVCAGSLKGTAALVKNP